ncbi:AfsR/SARP family transcriptional regulator [Catenuloplanes indicus]|uniref:DNA-binding SARP family transcriptional activator n=1 Tax=Catenuloplanes indicus TaxID=137267 RepID=A0AAE4AVY5_9ACTN|nr:BTAD domain-containing putative transcriptional regulator [Catenuloplanes indicus]MDQ0364459.1 DNA-binding SARP family transcriptional activator [Catenuloplanes indicus]
MEIRLLGPVEITNDDHTPVRPERAAQRGLLAALALRPGRLVSTDALIDCLWDGDPPEKAGETLAHYARAVRAALTAAGAAPGVLTNRRRTGYALHVPPESVDYHRFTALVRDAARETSAGPAADLYTRALAMWHGDALADIGTDWAERQSYRMRQERTDACCALFRRQMADGAHAAAATGVTALLTEITPTDDIIMIGLEALAHSGRHADIDQFLTDATTRMWHLAAARPSDSVRTLATHLTTNPPAAHRPPHESHESHGRDEMYGGRVQQTATNCGTVHFAGRDQYVYMSRFH